MSDATDNRFYREPVPSKEKAITLDEFIQALKGVGWTERYDAQWTGAESLWRKWFVEQPSHEPPAEPQDMHTLLVTTARDAGFGDAEWAAMFYDKQPYDVTYPTHTMKQFAKLLLERCRHASAPPPGAEQQLQLPETQLTELQIGGQSCNWISLTDRVPEWTEAGGDPPVLLWMDPARFADDCPGHNHTVSNPKYAALTALKAGYTHWMPLPEGPTATK